MTPRYRRGAGVEERRLGSAVFLAHPERGGIFRLNDTGSALWRLLEQPITPAAAVRVFRQAFPETPAADVHEGVLGLLDALVEDGLVEEA